MINRIKYLFFLLPYYVFAGTAGTGISQVVSIAQTLQNTITGPIAMLVSISAIAIAGMVWAFSDHGSGVRKFSAVVAGVLIAVNAAGWFATLFGANV